MIRALGYTVAFGLLGGFAYLCLGGLGWAVTGAAVCVWGVSKLDFDEEKNR